MSGPDQRRQSAERRRSRRLAMQALYQWQLSGENVQEIINQFLAEQDVQGADLEYFRELMEKITQSTDELDKTIAPLLDRPIETVGAVERAILYIASYEFLHRMDIPYKVVISEAVALTKKFGADQAHKFINGVLDRSAKENRKLEQGGF
jgi:N utilization substance protein B